jgi:hypothetical protein
MINGGCLVCQATGMKRSEFPTRKEIIHFIREFFINEQNANLETGPAGKKHFTNNGLRNSNIPEFQRAAFHMFFKEIIEMGNFFKP